MSDVIPANTKAGMKSRGQGSKDMKFDHRLTLQANTVQGLPWLRVIVKQPSLIIAEGYN